MAKQTFDPAAIPPVKVLNTMTSEHSLRKMMEAISCTPLVDHADRVMETLCDPNFWTDREEAALGDLSDKEAARPFVRKSLGFMRGVADLTQADFAQRASIARQAYCNAMRSSPDATLNRDLVFGFLMPSIEHDLKGKLVLSLSFNDSRHGAYCVDFSGFVQTLINEVRGVLARTKAGSATLGIGKFLSRIAKVMQTHIADGIKEKWGIPLSEGDVKVFIDQQFIGIEKSCEKSYEQINEEIRQCVAVNNAEKTAYTINMMSEMLREGTLWANGIMFGVMLPRQDAYRAGAMFFKSTTQEATLSFLFDRGRSFVHTRKALWVVNKIMDCLSAFSLSLCAHFMETLWTEEDALNAGCADEAYYTKRAQRWRALYPYPDALLSQFCQVDTKDNGKLFASVMALSCRKVIPVKKATSLVTGFTGRIIMTLNHNEKVCATSLIAQKYGFIPTPETVLLPFSEENSGQHFEVCPVPYSDIVVRLFDAKKKVDRDKPQTALSFWLKHDLRSHRPLHADVTNVGEDSATADVIYYSAGLAFMNTLLPSFQPSLFLMEENTKRRFFDFRKDCVFSRTEEDKSPAKAFSHDIEKLPLFCRGKAITIFAVGSASKEEKAHYLRNFKDVPALFRGTLTLDVDSAPLKILISLLKGNHALIVSLFPKVEKHDEVGEGDTSVVRHDGRYHRMTRKEAIAKGGGIDASGLCHAVIAFFYDPSERHLVDLSRALQAICFDCPGYDNGSQAKVDFYTALHLLRDGLIDLATVWDHDAEKARAVFLAMGQTKGRITSEAGSQVSGQSRSKAQKKEDMACAQSLKSLAIKIAPLPVRVPRALIPFVQSGDIELSVTQVSRYIALKREKKTNYDPRFVSTRTLSFREKVARPESTHNDLVFFDLSERSITAFNRDSASFPNIPHYDPLLNKTVLTVTDRRRGDPVVYHAFYQEKGRLQNDESIVTASVTDGRDAALSVFAKSLKDQTNVLAVRIFMKYCLAHACRNGILRKAALLEKFGSFEAFMALAQETCAAASPRQASFLQEHVAVVSQPVAEGEAFTSLLIDGFLLVTGITAKERRGGKEGVEVLIECAAISESKDAFVPSLFLNLGMIVYGNGNLFLNPDSEPRLKRSKVDKGSKGHTTKIACDDKLFKQKRNGSLFNLTAFARSLKEQGLPFYPLPFSLESGINAVLPKKEAGILVASPTTMLVSDKRTLMPHRVLTQNIFVSAKDDETTTFGIAHRNILETIVVCRETSITHPEDSEDQEAMLEIADLMLNLHSGITTIAKGTKHTTIFSYT